MHTPLGIYVHIPFCRQKCIYCDFYSLPNREEEMDAYCAALETRLLETDFSGCAADTVYFGGGTPSLLGPARLNAVLETVCRACEVVPEAEITLEANPDSAGDRNALRDLRSAGFNRISLGMQSASDAELASLGRVHTMEQVRRAVDAARGAGFDNLSLDLIYGLPGQNAEAWRKNLEAAVSLQPEHLSCYGLKAEKGTPLYARRDLLPCEEIQAEMYLETVEFLEANGFLQYEISNFAKPGRESRHNLTYWTLAEYAGFGPGAHSDFRGVRCAWPRDLTEWLTGRPALSERQKIPPEARAAEWLMLGLRTVYGLDPADYEKRFQKPFAPYLPFLRRCAQAGYALETAGRWRLTPQGFLVSNPIIGELLEILETQ